MAASVSATALLKLALHAAAHADGPVLGALVGKATAGGAIEVADALPLFHGHAGGMGPMLEVALLQAAAHAAAASHTLVGVYAANERLEDRALGPAARAAADAVARAAGKGAPVAALLLDGAALAVFSSGQGGVPLLAFAKSDASGKWAPAPAPAAPAAASTRFADAVAAGALDAVADFDDHLLDLKADWLNEGIKA